MIIILYVIHVLIAVSLVGVVMLQKSEGGALGMGGGGMSGFMTGRSTANLLTRTTAILAALFFGTSILLVVLSNSARAPRSSGGLRHWRGGWGGGRNSAGSAWRNGRRCTAASAWSSAARCPRSGISRSSVSRGFRARRPRPRIRVPASAKRPEHGGQPGSDTRSLRRRRGRIYPLGKRCKVP